MPDSMNGWAANIFKSPTEPNYNLTPEDYAFANRQLGIANEGIGGNLARARATSMGRLAQRGLQNSGIAEQSQNELEQGANVARTRAQGQYQDTLYNIRQSGLNFERQRALMRDQFNYQRSLLDDQRKYASSSQFWNMAGDLIQGGLDFFGTKDLMKGLGAGAGALSASDAGNIMGMFH